MYLVSVKLYLTLTSPALLSRQPFGQSDDHDEKEDDGDFDLTLPSNLDGLDQAAKVLGHVPPNLLLPWDCVTLLLLLMSMKVKEDGNPTRRRTFSAL